MTSKIGGNIFYTALAVGIATTIGWGVYELRNLPMGSVEAAALAPNMSTSDVSDTVSDVPLDQQDWEGQFHKMLGYDPHEDLE